MKNSNPNNRLVDTLWDLFSSVKLTVVVLILLAATSVVGTLIPQNAAPSAYIRTYGEFAYRLMRVLDIFDMYHSWWFQTLIVILSINISVCTIKRWPMIWKIVSSKELKIGSTIKKQPLAEFLDPRNPKELSSLYQGYFGKKYRTHQTQQENIGFRLIAEKGRWTRLGVPAVHLSIVIILAGALVGSFFGFDGYVNIPEGGSASYIRLRNSNDTLTLGFEVRCENFDVTFYESGSPKEFRSSLTILENGQKVVEKDIVVNDPLQYRGINFFQSSYGAMPPKVFDLDFTSNVSNRNMRQKVSIGQSLELPDSAGRFTAREYIQNFEYRGTKAGAALLGILEKPGKEPIEIALPLRFPTFDKMRKGEWVISIIGYDDAFYTGLQVTSDPGVMLVYAGFILLILGCWVAFFMSHKKIVVEVLPSATSSQIKVFGTVNRNRIGFEIAARKLGEDLSSI